MKQQLTLGLFLTCSAAFAASPQWPQFRGPGGRSVAEGQSLPEKFGPEENVQWKVPLPPGHSSPCIWEDRIFITAHEGGQLRMICLRRSDGKTLWTKARELKSAPRYDHTSCNPAVPTPCTDGQRVCFVFGDYGVIVLDFAGELAWEKKLPPPTMGFGAGASPVLAGDVLLLNRDGTLDSSLLCVEFATGKERWRAARKDNLTSYCSPHVWTRSSGTEVLAGGSGRLESYDLATGRSLWFVTGLPEFVCPTPITGSNLVYFGAWTTAHAGGRARISSILGEDVKLTEQELTDPKAFIARFDRNQDGKLSAAELPDSRAKDAFNFVDHNANNFWELAELEPLFTSAPMRATGRNVLVAIAPAGQGDLTASSVRWEKTKALPYVPSPLLYQARLYYVRDGGLFTCLDAKSGEPFFEAERLGVAGEYYASPVAVDGKILVAAQKGVIFILKASDRFELLGKADLKEQIFATPAIVGNRLYIRTDKNLWAFGK